MAFIEPFTAFASLEDTMEEKDEDTQVALKLNNLPKIHLLAEQLMEEKAGLVSKGWKFGFNTNRRRGGVCKYGPKKIELSIYHALLDSEDRVINTIIHEIAHAVAGFRNGHNSEWRRIAINLGCDGERCLAEPMKIKAKFVANCKNCNKEYRKHRRPKNKNWCYCKKCGPVNGRINFEDWRDSDE